MQQYDVPGRPGNVLIQLEQSIQRRGFSRVGVLGLGENERAFEGRTGCLGSLFMSTSEYVRISAVEQGGDTTRLLINANKRRNEQPFDDILTQELGARRVENSVSVNPPERKPCWKCGSPTTPVDIRCPSCGAWLRPQS